MRLLEAKLISSQYILHEPAGLHKDAHEPVLLISKMSLGLLMVEVDVAICVEHRVVDEAWIIFSELIAHGSRAQ